MTEGQDTRYDFDALFRAAKGSAEELDALEADEDFTAAISDLFATTMEALEVPDDENVANALLGDTVRALMRRTFMAGVMFEFQQNQDLLEQAQGVPVLVDPSMASQIVTGLLSNDGVSLRLVVDRG